MAAVISDIDCIHRNITRNIIICLFCVCTLFQSGEGTLISRFRNVSVQFSHGLHERVNALGVCLGADAVYTWDV